MPQTYSEFQLQRNRVTGQAVQNILTRAAMIGGDIFKMLLAGITAIIRGLTGK